MDQSLSAEQVFQIADPRIALNVEIETPTVKVDLKARLAIELNRQIMQSNEGTKKHYRKLLKQLLNDKMTVKEEEATLNDLLFKISLKEHRSLATYLRYIQLFKSAKLI